MQLKKSNAGEAMHLFDVMEKHEAVTMMNLHIGRSSSPFITAGGGVCTSKDGDTLHVRLGSTRFPLNLETHYFSKNVTDSQINICISNDKYDILITSEWLSPEIIKEANQY